MPRLMREFGNIALRFESVDEILTRSTFKGDTPRSKSLKSISADSTP